MIYNAMPHLNGHLLAAIDFETTGKRAGFHEPVQIAVVPLDSELRPHQGLVPFYTNMKPLHPERAERAATYVHRLNMGTLVQTALHPSRVADLFVEWFENLELPHKKVLVPLAHNWSFERSFLNHWLGVELTDAIFHSHARDSMVYAISKNDAAFFLGEKAPFPRVSLTYLCRHFGVDNTRPHDALCDAIAEAEVYKHLLQMDIL